MSAGEADGPRDGVLVVDKPPGRTSHDVVARLRRLLGTRRVGHAGTLDPMATGVLVALVGEGTKLAPYLTADDKSYLAVVAFGTATDTLDADGRPTVSAEVPPDLLAEIAAVPAPVPRIAAALAAEAARREQVPPVYSAIHVDGERSYDRARAGEVVDLAPRSVAVRHLVLDGPSPGEARISLDLTVSKGYYVRSLARDLGEHLGVPAHLAALRRTRSGAFTLADAVPLDAGAERLKAAILSPGEAARRALPVGRLGEEGVQRARQGKRLGAGDFIEPPPTADVSAWVDPGGRLVAVGAGLPDGSFVVQRGFA
jgi:tRNA pseudouridine55 synthase